MKQNGTLTLLSEAERLGVIARGKSRSAEKAVQWVCAIYSAGGYDYDAIIEALATALDKEIAAKAAWDAMGAHLVGGAK